MKHISEKWHVATASVEKQKEFDAFSHKMSQRVESSRKGIFKYVSFLNACVYLSFSMLLALILPARKTKNAQLAKDLAEYYAYVPEMAIQKKVELDAYLEVGLSGDGIDFGAGSGYVGGLLKKYSNINSLHGLDFCEQTELAKQNGYSAYTECSVEDIPLKDESFDFVISVCVLEHVANLNSTLYEAHRLLRANGGLYFTTPAPAYRFASIGVAISKLFGMALLTEKQAKIRDLKACHYHYYDKRQWIEMLQEIGFSNVEIVPIYSKKQLRIYELLNYSTNFLKIYPNFYSQQLIQRKTIRKLVVKATEKLCNKVSTYLQTESNATHWFIVAKK